MTNRERSRQLRAMLELVRDIAHAQPETPETDKILAAYTGGMMTQDGPAYPLTAPTDADAVDQLVGQGDVLMRSTELVARRLRTPAELALAAEQLRHAGFTKCDACSAWHDETMRCEAHGSARDPRCSYCGHTNRAED